VESDETERVLVIGLSDAASVDAESEAEICLSALNQILIPGTTFQDFGRVGNRSALQHSLRARNHVNVSCISFPQPRYGTAPLTGGTKRTSGL
jgi:hypothetical protein